MYLLIVINPYWQILENFPEISVFRDVTQTDFWENSSCIFFEISISRAWAGPISGKLVHIFHKSVQLIPRKLANKG